MAFTEEDHSKVNNPNLLAKLPYPRMVYRDGGVTRVVRDLESHAAATKDGWQDEPVIAPVPEIVEPVTLESLDARMARLETMLGTILEQQERLENLLDSPKHKNKKTSEQAA